MKEIIMESTMILLYQLDQDKLQNIINTATLKEVNGIKYFVLK